MVTALPLAALSASTFEAKAPSSLAATPPPPGIALIQFDANDLQNDGTGSLHPGKNTWEGPGDCILLGPLTTEISIIDSEG